MLGQLDGARVSLLELIEAAALGSRLSIGFQIGY